MHALRGWATPLGASMNSAETKFDEDGGASDEKSVRTLRLIGQQVAEFATRPHALRLPVSGHVMPAMWWHCSAGAGCCAQ